MDKLKARIRERKKNKRYKLRQSLERASAELILSFSKNSENHFSNPARINSRC